MENGIFAGLPERDENHKKNDRGRLAFREIFTDPLFIVREEMENDYGVDMCIEALVNNGKSPSNIRVYVQLKSSNKDANIDGTYSYKVALSNFNYLMNNPCSFYTFYSLKENRFYYRFADDIFAEYNVKGNGWKRNKTLTVNFRDRIDNGALQLIHEHIIQTSIMFKELRIQMSKSNVKPGAKFVYGEWVFESSAEQFEEYMRENGQPFVYSIDENGKVILLHNFIWELNHGPIPKGYQVYHVNGNTLDNTDVNLDIIKTSEIFDIEGFQKEIEEFQAHNILAIISEGKNADIKDVLPPTSKMFNGIISELQKQGWTISDEEMTHLKEDMAEYLGICFRDAS